MKNGENVIYYCQFDTVGKSYDELLVISEESFGTLKLAVEKTSAFLGKQDKAEALKLLRACVGVAVLESASLSLGADLLVKLTADEFSFSEPFNILFARLCYLAKSVKIENEAQKCVVSIE